MFMRTMFELSRMTWQQLIKHQELAHKLGAAPELLNEDERLYLIQLNDYITERAQVTFGAYQQSAVEVQ
jgi:hypothetical protein